MNVSAASAPEIRLSVSISSLASAFLGVGLALILLESLFFEQVAALAHSSYGPRAIFGFHLFFSEMWFIFVGNAVVGLLLVRQDFRFERRMVRHTAPIALIFTVYALWFVYGSLSGNNWALEEFREMAFNVLCMPSVLYFASRVDAATIFKRFIYFSLPIIVLASPFAAHKTLLMIGTFVAAYFVLQLLNGHRSAMVGLFLIMLPFFVRFEKPMIALLAFTLIATSVLAGHLNPVSKKWLLSKFKLRILGIGFMLLLSAICLAVVINSLTNGLIEEVIRFHFLKVRLNSGGELQTGDLSGGRMAIWTAALLDWQEKPLFGHGLGASVRAFSAGWVTKSQFHNYFVQALHNTGLIGCSLIVGAWSVWLHGSIRRVYRTRDERTKLILACMLVYVFGVLFYGLYGHSLSFPPTAQLFWVFVGVLSVAGRNWEKSYR